MEAFHARSSILQTVVLINQTYLKSGWGKNFEQIFSLGFQPEGLETLTGLVIANRSKNNVLDSLEKLCDGTEELLKREKKKLGKENSCKDVFENFYEELSSTFQKIRKACESNIPEVVFSACSILQDEVKWSMYLLGDPDIEERFTGLEPLRFYESSNLQPLSAATVTYERELVEVLEANGVPITRIEGLQAFQDYLKLRGGKQKMNEASSAKTMWEDYLKSLTGEERNTVKYEAWHFCDNKRDANELAELVRSGVKRATASLYESYEFEGEPVPKAGDHSIILDWSGIAQCIIRTTKVTVVPYGEVSEEFARTEGEGDKSLTYWRHAHWEYFSREMKELGKIPSDEMLVVCEEFEVVHK